MWKTIEQRHEHEVAVDTKNRFFLDKEIKQTPKFYSVGQKAVKSRHAKTREPGNLVPGHF